MLLVLQVTAARIGRGGGEGSIVMNTVLIENGMLLLMLLILLMAPLLLEVRLLLVRMMRKLMLAVTLDCGGRVAVDGVLEALPRPAKVVLWHLIHAAADVASAVWLIHHPDATGVMLPLAALLPPPSPPPPRWWWWWCSS